MALISANNISKAYGADDIFIDVSVSIPHKARIALVGPNGSGKTSLLRILVGDDMPNAGKVNRAGNIRIGYLPQRSEELLTGDKRLWDEMLVAYQDLIKQENYLVDLAEKLAEHPDDEELLEKYGKMQVVYESSGGYEYSDWTTQVLRGLGFTPDDFYRPISQLSGGQKTRALLARLLLEKPDVLILDEPTNHLDIKAIEWLENWLIDYEGALLVVSHDRYFMDKVVSNVWELVFGQLEIYRGNFTHFVRQREERHENILKEYKRQQQFVAKELDYISRNIEGQNTRQAQGRRKRLERYLRDEAINRPLELKSISVGLEAKKRSGDQVLIVNDLILGYQDDQKPLFKSPDIVLRRGECAALIGPNGTGKSTFIKTILGEIPPLSGSVRIGSSVEVGYFAQAHEKLDPENSILDELLEVKHLLTSEARSFLGAYLFSGDDVFKKVSQLSGGERGRVALAKLALSGANVLLLDEPTNHLDIPSQEIIESVLQNYEGTILLVSHDRYLIRNLATQIWSLQKLDTDNGKQEMIVYEGGYDEHLAFMNKNKEKKVKQKVTVVREAKSKRRDAYTERERKRLINKIEGEIDNLEVKLVNLSGELDVASSEGNVSLVTEYGSRFEETKKAIEDLMLKWEELNAER